MSWKSQKNGNCTIWQLSSLICWEDPWVCPRYHLNLTLWNYTIPWHWQTFQNSLIIQSGNEIPTNYLIVSFCIIYDLQKMLGCSMLTLEMDSTLIEFQLPIWHTHSYNDLMKHKNYFFPLLINPLPITAHALHVLFLLSSSFCSCKNFN